MNSIDVGSGVGGLNYPGAIKDWTMEGNISMTETRKGLKPFVDGKS